MGQHGRPLTKASRINFERRTSIGDPFGKITTQQTSPKRKSLQRISPAVVTEEIRSSDKRFVTARGGNFERR